MGRSKASSWIAGAVVVGLLLATAGWFLLVSPVLSTASETRTAAESTRSSNDALALRVQRLKGQFEHLDEDKAELAALQLQIPTTAELANYLRQLDAAATASGVMMTAITPGTPTGVVIAAATVAGASDGTVTDDAGTDDAAVEDPAAEDPAANESAAAPTTGVPAGFVQVPISLTAVGNYESVVGFIDALQTGTQRLLLVTSVNGTGQDDAEASGGRPATRQGDVEITLSGVAYVLQEIGAAPTADATTPAAPPAAVPGKNPLIPVG